MTPTAPRLFRYEGDWPLARAVFSVLVVAAAIVVVFLALAKEAQPPPTFPGSNSTSGGERHANCRPGCGP
jgi:hypothetical protein